MTTPQNERLWFRVNPEVKRAFMEKAERNGRCASDVLREFFIAWVEGRVTIHPHE